MSQEADTQLAMLLLHAAAEIVEGITAGVAARGYPDVRPVHGFAFVRISRGDAGVNDVAEHLGVTKQAASKLVDQLVGRGYVDRVVDADDARAWRLSLTKRGWACTRAADAAAAEVIATWRSRIGDQAVEALRQIVPLLGAERAAKPIRLSW